MGDLLNDDPYTIDLRLCDDEGMVSHEEIVESHESRDESYLARLNRLRNLSLWARGDKAEKIEEPFHCTGNAHLAGEHIRCTSPAHHKVPQMDMLYSVPVGTVLPFSSTHALPEGYHPLNGSKLLVSQYGSLAHTLSLNSVTLEMWRGWGGDLDDTHITLPNHSFPEYGPQAVAVIRVR